MREQCKRSWLLLQQGWTGQGGGDAGLQSLGQGSAGRAAGSLLFPANLSILGPPCHILPGPNRSLVNVTGAELAQHQVLSSWLPWCWGWGA